MKTINEFVSENKLKVCVDCDEHKYICYIVGEDGAFRFTMTRERLLEHIRKFTQQEFVEAILSDEKAVKTHFRRLAVTWWHIAVLGDRRNMDIE